MKRIPALAAVAWCVAPGANRWAFGLILIASAVGSLTAAPGTTEAKQPNILILYTDQQRYDTIAALGHPFIKTPNLDRLCAAGVAFTQAFASSPVCLSSRWSLFSGLYPTTTRSYSNHHSGVRPASNLALALKNAGYRTGLIGKNHSFLDARTDLDVLGGSTQPIDSPATVTVQLQAWFKQAGVPLPPPIGVDPDLEARVGAYQTKISSRLRKSEATPQSNLMHQQTDACMNFIAGSQERKQPFFAWMSWLYPHTPYEASQPFYSLYDGVNLPPPVVEPNGLAQANKPFRQIFHQENNDRILPFSHVYQQRMQRTYCAAISQVDFEIGRILDFLEARGLLENTILLFSSDHGDYQGDHGMFTKSPALYDCLIRVPLICVWPGRWAAGVRSPELVSQVDLMPTLLSAAGISVPAGVQGLDLNPVLRHGKADTPLRDAVFAEYGIPGAPFNRERLERVYPDYKKKPVDVQGNGVTWEANPIALAGRFRMVRTQNWKFIHEPGGTSELYDLRSDPSELVNLWNHPEHQAIEAQLLAKLIAWQNSLPGIEHDQDDLVTPDIAKLGKHTRKKR